MQIQITSGFTNTYTYTCMYIPLQYILRFNSEISHDDILLLKGHTTDLNGGDIV